MRIISFYLSNLSNACYLVSPGKRFILSPDFGLSIDESSLALSRFNSELMWVWVSRIDRFWKSFCIFLAAPSFLCFVFGFVSVIYSFS